MCFPIKTGIIILGVMFMYGAFQNLVAGTMYGVLGVGYAIDRKEPAIILGVVIGLGFIYPYYFYFGRFWIRWFKQDSEETRIGILKWFRFQYFLMLVICGIGFISVFVIAFSGHVEVGAAIGSLIMMIAIGCIEILIVRYYW